MSQRVSNDLFPRIAYFLESPQDVLSLMQVSRFARAESWKVISEKYQECFGKFNAECDSPELQHALRLHLHSVGKVVDRCAASFSRMRPSMATGRQLQQEYERMVDLLHQTESTTIIQLKNRALALGFTQGSCYGYRQDFADLDFYDAISECGRKLSATLSSFSLGGQQYAIKAALEDQGSTLMMNFLLKTLTGSVIISVENKEDGARVYFPVALGRCSSFNSQIEKDLMLEKPEDIWPVKRESRWVLDVRNIDLTPSRVPFDPDQKLGRKIIQLLIEMAKQDPRISEIRVQCSNFDPWVFAAAGFGKRYSIYPIYPGASMDQTREHLWRESIQKILEFRQNPQNPLFPTEDASSTTLVFEMNSFKEERVYFKRGGESESWEEIIAQNPLLPSQAGILPEFWVKEQPKCSDVILPPIDLDTDFI